MQKIKLSIVFRQSVKKHLMEFELHIKLLLFHTNAGTDVHVRLESPRTRASSEAELRGKLQKMLCTTTRKDIVRTQRELPSTPRLHHYWHAHPSKLADVSSINQPSGNMTFIESKN